MDKYVERLDINRYFLDRIDEASVIFFIRIIAVKLLKKKLNLNLITKEKLLLY